MKIILAIAWPTGKHFADWQYFNTQKEADDYIEGYGNGLCCYSIEEVIHGMRLFDKSVPEKVRVALRRFYDYYNWYMPEHLK